MKKALIAISCIATLGLVAGDANAQCGFDIPAKAKGLKLTFVRHFAGCGNSTTFGVPNTTTETGTPACEPPAAASAFTFGVKGSCSAKTKQQVSKANSAFSTVSINAKCKDIALANGTTQINGPGDDGWRVATLSRATMNDPLNGDITVIDFPLGWGFEEPKKGGIKLKSDSDFALDALGLPPIPACTSVHVLSATVNDPSGKVFATLGTSSF